MNLSNTLKDDQHIPPRGLITYDPTLPSQTWGMFHLARHDQLKMLAQLEISMLLNHHLTSDSYVDSSRDPVSYKS